MCLCLDSGSKLCFTDMKMKQHYLGVIHLFREKIHETVQIHCIPELPVLLHSLTYLYQSSLGN